VVYYVWGEIPGSWLEVLSSMRQNDPLRLFHLMVMPIAAAALAVVAGWRIIPRWRFS